MTPQNRPNLPSQFQQLEIPFETRNLEKKEKHTREIQEQEEEDELIELISLQSDLTPLICLQLSDLDVISTILKSHYTLPSCRINEIAKSLLSQKIVKSMLVSLRKTKQLYSGDQLSENLVKIILSSCKQNINKTLERGYTKI